MIRQDKYEYYKTLKYNKTKERGGKWGEIASRDCAGCVTKKKNKIEVKKKDVGDSEVINKKIKRKVSLQKSKSKYNK